MLILVHDITCLQIEMKDDHYQSHRCTRRVNIKCCIVLVVAETTAEKGITHSKKILFSLYTGRFCRYQRSLNNVVLSRYPPQNSLIKFSGFAIYAFSKYRKH